MRNLSFVQLLDETLPWLMKRVLPWLRNYVFPSNEAGRRSPLQLIIDLFFALFFVTPILISINLKQVFNTPKYLFVGAVAVLAGATWFVSVLHRRELALPRHPTLLLFAALVGWEFVTLAWASSPGWCLRDWSFQFALLVLCFVAAANIKDKERIENLLHFAVASGVIASGFALLQYYQLDESILPRLQIDGWFNLSYLVLPAKPDETVKVYSFMGHRNYLAGYLICLLPIVLSRVLSSVSIALRGGRYCGVAWRQALVYGLTFLLMFTVVVLTQTRGGWVGLTVGLLAFFGIVLYKFGALELARGATAVVVLMAATAVVFGAMSVSSGVVAAVALGGLGLAVALLSMRGRSLLVAVALVASLAVGVGVVGTRLLPQKSPLNRIGISALDRFAHSFDLRSGSAFQRVLIWRTAWRIITDNPVNFLFGWGVGTFGLNYMPFQAKLLAEPGNDVYTGMVNKSIYSHNEFLHWWAELGLVGLLLLAAVIGTFYWSMGTFVARCEANYQNLLLIGMLCGTIAVLAHQLFTFCLHLPYTASLFWCVVAFCLHYEGGQETVLRWGSNRAAERQASVDGGLLTLGLLPLVNGRVRAVAAWAMAPRSDAPRAELVLLGALGDPLLERPVPGPFDGPVAFDRKGEPGDFGLVVRGPSGELARLQPGPTSPGAEAAADVWAWAGTAVIALVAVAILRVLWGEVLIDYYWRNAFLKFRLRRFEESVIDFRRALAIAPDRGEVLFDYGRALMDSNRNLRAVTVFEAAKGNFVDPANDHNIALCYYKEREYALAEKHYRAALDLNPIYEQSLANLGFHLVGEGRTDEARKLLELGIKYYPTGASFYASLGVLEARVQNLERAADLLQKALDRDPTLATAQVNLATVLFNLKRYDEARIIYEKLQKDRPEEPLVQQKLLGTWAAIYQQRLAKNPDDAEALKLMAVANVRLGLSLPDRLKEAVAQLRQYLVRFPEDGEARCYLGLAMQAMGFLPEAVSGLKAAQALLAKDHPLQSTIEERLRVIAIRIEEGASRGTAPAPAPDPAPFAAPSLLPALPATDDYLEQPE